MLTQIKGSIVKKLLPKRNVKSHKGQNGRVLIVGGSKDFYGAPVLAGLAALKSSADLIYLFVPESNFDCSRSLYPDFIVKSYPGEFLTERYASTIIEFGRKCDSLLIGPGLGNNELTQDAVFEIIKNLHIPTVLDAEAISVIKKIENFPLAQPILITPHKQEFQNLVDREIIVNEEDTKSIILLRSISMDLHLSVLLKGPYDFISSDEGVVEINTSGNAGMTVGGTGDVLAGVAACLMAQGLEVFDAARVAAYYVGKAGDYLFKKQGYGFTASELAMALPKVFN